MLGLAWCLLFYHYQKLTLFGSDHEPPYDRDVDGIRYLLEGQASLQVKGHVVDVDALALIKGKDIVIVVTGYCDVDDQFSVDVREEVGKALKVAVLGDFPDDHTMFPLSSEDVAIVQDALTEIVWFIGNPRLSLLDG